MAAPKYSTPADSGVDSIADTDTPRITSPSVRDGRREQPGRMTVQLSPLTLVTGARTP